MKKAQQLVQVEAARVQEELARHGFQDDCTCGLGSILLGVVCRPAPH